VLDAPQLVEQVHDGQPRVAESHAWSCVTHDHPGLLALRRLVAMDRALGAGRLGLAVRTLFQPPLGVVEELAAFVAGPARTVRVVVTAIDRDHALHGTVLALQAVRRQGHGACVTSSNRATSMP